MFTTIFLVIGIGMIIAHVTQNMGELPQKDISRPVMACKFHEAMDGSPRSNCWYCRDQYFS